MLKSQDAVAHNDIITLLKKIRQIPADESAGPTAAQRPKRKPEEGNPERAGTVIFLHVYKNPA